MEKFPAQPDQNQEQKPAVEDVVERTKAKQEAEALAYAVGLPRPGENIVYRHMEGGQKAVNYGETWKVKSAGSKFIAAERINPETGQAETRLISMSEKNDWHWMTKNNAREVGFGDEEKNRKLAELRNQIFKNEHPDLPPPIGTRIRVKRSSGETEDDWKVAVVDKDEQTMIVVKDLAGGKQLSKSVSFKNYFDENR